MKKLSKIERKSINLRLHEIFRCLTTNSEKNKKSKIKDL